MPRDEHEIVNGEAAADEQFMVHDMMQEVAADLRRHEVERAMRSASSLLEATELAKLVVSLLAERSNEEAA